MCYCTNHCMNICFSYSPRYYYLANFFHQDLNHIAYEIAAGFDHRWTVSSVHLVVVIGEVQLVFTSFRFFFWCSKLLKHFIRPVNSMTKMNPLFKALYVYKPLQHMNSGTLASDKPSFIITPVLMKSEGNNLAFSPSKQCLCN